MQALSRAEGYRNYSEELRAIATSVNEGRYRQTLLDVADSFERMATAVEAVDRSRDLLRPGDLEPA